MEFKYGLWVGVSSIFGEDGRQLGESNTRPPVFNRNVPAEIQTCHYPGTRNGKSINVSALRTAMKHFYDASAITVAICDYHMTQMGKSSEELPGIWDLYVVSRASLALIAYRYRADKVPTREHLPDELASQYKLVTGIFMIARDMMFSSCDAATENRYMSADELYDFADENQIFRAGTDMVCAGSTRKILEFLEFAINRHHHSNSNKLPIQNYDDSKSFLGRYVSDLEGWYRYALLTIELDCFVQLEIFRQQNVPSVKSSPVPSSIVDAHRRRYDYWCELTGRNDDVENSYFPAEILQRQNDILALLKIPKVESIPGKVISTRLSH